MKSTLELLQVIMAVIDRFDGNTSDTDYDKALSEIYGLCEDHKDALDADMTKLVEDVCDKLGVNVEITLSTIIDKNK